MPLLKEELRNHVAQVFSTQLLHPVTIHFFTQESSLLGVPAYECLTCREARALLEEVASLSDKLTLQVHDFLADEEQARHFGIDRMPALVLEGRNKGVLRYFGIPAGFEFAVVVEDLTDVSRGATQISDTARRQLAGLGAPVHIKVFVTPTCPYSAHMARFAHQLAVENSLVTADVIEVSEFPELTHRYGLMSVPKIIVNETGAAILERRPSGRRISELV